MAMYAGIYLAGLRVPTEFRAPYFPTSNRRRYAELTIYWHTRVYPKVSWLAARSENYKWYSSLPLGAVASLFC